MRNLKRALSLALASVMLLGMMVVGAGAASYPDVSSEDNVEAIEVLNAVKVMVGKKGNFDPDAPVNRHEMAVIMAKLYLGTEAADNYVGTHPFTDVYPWADKYVAACYENGLISGTSKTTYGGNQPLTAIQAAAMMLRALGYEDLSKGAADWRTPVAAKANQIRLFKDVVSNPSAQLTRNQVAQLALNTLKADVVETERGADVTIGDVAISTSIKYNRVELKSEGDDNYAGDGGAGAGYLQLCEKLYEGELTFGDAAEGDDDFGRPASKWTYGKTEVLVNKTPSVTFVDKTSEADVEKAVKGYDYPTTETTKWENGKKTEKQTMTDAAIAALTGDGTLVEIYTDSNKKVTDVVVVTYSVDTVKSITEKNGKTTYKFETATSKYNDEDNTNVIIDGSVDEGDVVTIAKVGSKYYVYPTTSFTGAQSLKKSSGDTVTLTIGGEKYVVANHTGVDTTDFTNSKDDATYYVDKNGFIVKVENLEKKAAEYAVIAHAAASETTGDLNKSDYTVKVRAVLADGSVKDFTLKTSVLNDEDAKTHAGSAGDLICGDMVVCLKDNLGTVNDTVATNLAGELVGYTLDDGEMVLETVTAGSGSMDEDGKYSVALKTYGGETSASADGATALMTKNTTFVLWSIDKDSNNKVTVEAPITGTADLSVKDATGAALIKASGTDIGTAEVVFLETESVAKEEDYVYISDDNYVGVGTNDKDEDIDIWEGVAADGSTVEVHAAEGTITKAGLYVYDTDGKLNTTAKVDVDTEAPKADAEPKENTYYHVTVKMSDDLIQVGKAYVSMADAEVQSVDKDGAAALENGAKAFVVMSNDDAGKVAAIFVYKAAPEEGDDDKKDEEKHEHDYKWAKATEEDVTAAAEAKITIEKDEHVLKCEGKTGECDAVYKADDKHKVGGITEDAAGKLTPACTLDTHTGS